MKTGFNSENIKATIKTLAIPDANYSFNVINWNLKKIDTNIHKQLTGNIIRHQEATDVRLYCQEAEGRDGIQLELSCKISKIWLYTYQDWFLQVMNHVKSKKLYSVSKEVYK